MTERSSGMTIIIRNNQEDCIVYVDIFCLSETTMLIFFNILGYMALLWHQLNKDLEIRLILTLFSTLLNNKGLKFSIIVLKKLINNS